MKNGFTPRLPLFSKHRPSGPMLSISRNVRPSVCRCVCSLLRYRLNVFLPPLPEVGCPKFLEIRNTWGKVMERSGLRFEHFSQKWSKIAAQKKIIFLANFALPAGFFWYWCYYRHRSRDSLSHVCRIF